MPRISIVFGILLIALGLVGYLGGAPAAEEPAVAAEDAAAEVAGESEKRSVTALIPGIFGAILLVCGLISMNEKVRMHAMHVAATVGLLGALAGLGRGISGIGKFMSNDPDLNRRAFVFVWLMAILCLIFVVLCVRSFMEARRQRTTGE